MVGHMVCASIGCHAYLGELSVQISKVKLHGPFNGLAQASSVQCDGSLVACWWYFGTLDFMRRLETHHIERPSKAFSNF